jgi:3-oxoadipate enol-lactonase
MSEFEHNTIAVNGVDLNYRIDGKPEGPKIMFSNSLATNLSMWDPQVEALKNRYRILRYDKRGHGGSSEFDTPITMQTLAQDAVDLAREVGFLDAHFVGLSIGGMTGQAIGIHHPGTFRSLSLCATTSQIPPEMHPLWHDRIALVKEKGMEPLVASTLERWFSEGYRDNHADKVAAIGNMVRNTSTTGYNRCSEAIIQMNFTEALAGVETPCLVVPGELDPALNVGMSEVIRDAIPGARMEIVKGAAHISNIEKADAFNRIIQQFFDGIEGTA